MRISAVDTVADLKKRIKAWKAIPARAHAIQLFLARRDGEWLASTYQNEKLAKANELDEAWLARELHPSELIEDVFDMGALGRGAIHVLVRHPPEGNSRESRRLDKVVDEEQLKHEEEICRLEEEDVKRKEALSAADEEYLKQKEALGAAEEERVKWKEALRKADVVVLKAVEDLQRMERIPAKRMHDWNELNKALGNPSRLEDRLIKCRDAAREAEATQDQCKRALCVAEEEQLKCKDAVRNAIIPVRQAEEALRKAEDDLHEAEEALHRVMDIPVKNKCAGDKAHERIMSMYAGRHDRHNRTMALYNASYLRLDRELALCKAEEKRYEFESIPDKRKRDWDELNEVLSEKRGEDGSTAFSAVEYESLPNRFRYDLHATEGPFFDLLHGETAKTAIDDATLDALVDTLEAKHFAYKMTSKEYMQEFLSAIFERVVYLFKEEDRNVEQDDTTRLYIRSKIAGNYVKANGTMDFQITRGARTLCIMEAHNWYFEKASAQAILGMEVSVDNKYESVYGVATDYNQWYFLKRADKKMEIAMDVIASHDELRRGVKRVAGKLYAMLAE